MRRVLILSQPRSGSSWLGAAAATSDRVRYLREPVLQARLGQTPDPFCASSGLSTERRQNLMRSIDQAFGDVDRDFLVVKEVTPLLLADFLEVPDLEVVYLRRHPAAVAASHVAQGWLPRPAMVNRAGLLPVAQWTLADLWESSSDLVRLIAYYGAVDMSVRAMARQHQQRSVFYEEMVRGRLGELTPLFTDMGLSAAALASPELDSSGTDAYGVGQSRRTTDSAGVWTGDGREARAAWMRFDPTSYISEDEWNGVPGSIAPN